MSQISINYDLFKKFRALLVYIGIALLAISDSGIQLLILHVIGPGSRTLRLAAMWFLFAKVILTRYTKKEFFILAPLTVLALYNYTRSGNIYCVYAILVIASLKDIEYSKLLRRFFTVPFCQLSSWASFLSLESEARHRLRRILAAALWKPATASVYIIQTSGIRQSPAVSCLHASVTTAS